MRSRLGLTRGDCLNVLPGEEAVVRNPIFPRVFHHRRVRLADFQTIQTETQVGDLGEQLVCPGGNRTHASGLTPPCSTN